MFDLPAIDCPGLAEAEIMSKIVRVESSGNPFAIGVVGGRLQRQPTNLQEAVLTVQQLETAGYNYSIGLSQINRIHFKRLGWSGDIQKGFDICRNLEAGADVYVRCKQGATRSPVPDIQDGAVRAALSCYNSGNYLDGEKSGYVSKVLADGGDKSPPPKKSPFRSMFD
ncbi:lytic transglycosylase domain-containing protein [Roseateles sp. BYS96W]|uniref:Lytic transglycosylase domain-containing protein n=1 Tax=Pelomonas nitida TaxID=3299027 RepID=A0ABW7G3J2_9BURK